MTSMIIGVLATAGFLLLADRTRRRGLRLAWWKWVIAVAGFLYGAFVLAVVTSLLEEGFARAAAVMAGVLGTLSAAWGLGIRFLFFAAGAKAGEAQQQGGEA